MNNEIPKPDSKPEQESKGHPRTSVAELSPAHTEQAQEWLAKYADEPVEPRLNVTEREQEIAELERLLTTFESTQPIAELYAIQNIATDITAQNSLKRETAKEGLNPIANSLNILKDLSDIPPQQYDVLKARYKYLSHAVGIINNGTIDHDR